jgi:hypothetical protein
MKLPLLKNKENIHPGNGRCSWCQKDKITEPYSMAVLSGGALLLNNSGDTSKLSNNLSGFFYLTWHGAHNNQQVIDGEIYETLLIAHNVEGGQFSIYFCSTNCVRAFLNKLVDDLESKVKKASE